MNEHDDSDVTPTPPWRRTGPAPSFPVPTIPGVSALLILAVTLGLPLFIWFFCRIEPGPDQIAILIRKTGKSLPSGEIVATSPDTKGIQLAVLPPGRYFRNPYSWSWSYAPITDIPAGKVGVRTRLFGADLPPGRILADNGSKGIEEAVLQPGKHLINPFAYKVQQYDAVTIRPGCVGVVTRLVGRDVLTSDLPAANRNTLLMAGDDLKGVVPETLDPGTYYLNPFRVNVVEVNLQSQRFEMGADDPINFLTQDGFSVHVDGTLEFSLQREMAALLAHRVGDMNDILQKIVLPRARGFIRTEGSKHPSTDFIAGETRQNFQNRLAEHLKNNCESWGVLIKSVLIRNIQPPDDIASVIREREVAVQTALKFDQQIAEARSQAELARQQMLAEQNRAKVEAETAQLRAVILAQQNLAVQETAAQRELEVARIDNEAATFQAQARISKATAERDVIKMTNEAEAAVMRNQAAAFGTGAEFGRYTLLRKLAPRIQSVLAGDQPDGLGAMFRPDAAAAEKGGRP